jgi:pimeloyl-ACP methyl ester carboxylesterase
MSTPAAPPFTTGAVTSTDGTTIGYRQVGQGPAVVLVHGGMQAAQSFSQLALALAPDFTAYTYDRRGRGASGPYGANYHLQRDVEDLSTLLRHTGARCVFGLSSGALIALNTALADSAISRLALYEPPLSVNHSSDTLWLPRFDREIAAGDLAAAMVTVMKGTGDTSFFSRLPRFLTVPLLRAGMQSNDTAPGDVPLGALVPTMHYDGQLVREAAESADTYRALPAKVLLLGGSRSAAYLKLALDRLEQVLPYRQRRELAGLDHIAAANDGHPAQVAAELRRFFTAS